MFYDTESNVLDSDKSKLCKLLIDLQPFEKTMQFEDDIEIDITARAFCNKQPEVISSNYLLVGVVIYKIMKIKEWSDYLECWLYQCEVD